METKTQTRSGRISKPPIRYEPVEQVDDDYSSDDYDESESVANSALESSADEEEEDDDDDGSSLEDFVESDDDTDKSESEEEDNGPSPVSVKKRGVPAATGARRPRGQSATTRQSHAFSPNGLPSDASA